MNSRVTGATVVHGHLAVNKPLDGGVSVHAVLLSQISLLGGIDLQAGQHEGQCCEGPNHQQNLTAILAVLVC